MSSSYGMEQASITDSPLDRLLVGATALGVARKKGEKGA